MRCVVCDAKWCNSCISSGAEKKSSGWKCNGCVGTASKNPQKVKRRRKSLVNTNYNSIPNGHHGGRAQPARQAELGKGTRS